MHSNEHQSYIEAAAKNLNCDKLIALARHQAARVRARIAERSDTPLPLLLELTHDSELEVRVAVAARDAIPPAVLARLLFDLPEVRFELAENPHTCLTQLQALTQDSNPYVSERAWHTLAALDLPGVMHHIAC